MGGTHRVRAQERGNTPILCGLRQAERGNHSGFLPQSAIDWCIDSHSYVTDFLDIARKQRLLASEIFQ